MLSVTEVVGFYDSTSNICIGKRRIPYVANNRTKLRRLLAVILGYYIAVVGIDGMIVSVHSLPFDCAVRGRRHYYNASIVQELMQVGQ